MPDSILCVADMAQNKANKSPTPIDLFLPPHYFLKEIMVIFSLKKYFILIIIKTSNIVAMLLF